MDQAGESWNWLVQTAAAVLLLVGHGAAAALLRTGAEPRTAGSGSGAESAGTVTQQEQAMPAMVLNRYRNSICYVFGVYQVGFPHQPARLRARVSGTGFIVATG